MQKKFLRWLLSFLAAVSLFIFAISTPFQPVSANRHTLWFDLLVVLLLILILMLALGAFYRWPFRRSRRLPVAEIERFRSMRSRTKFDGEAMAIHLVGTIETQSSAKGSYVSASDSPALQVKFGEGGLSIPVTVLGRAWSWVRAREVIKVRGIIDDYASPTRILLYFKTVAVAAELTDERLGLEKAVLQVARELLKNLDPISLARRYWSEGNYLLAIRVLNAVIAEVGVDPEIEFDLAQLELQCDRFDSALNRLLRLQESGVPKKLRRRFSVEMARAHFGRGEYDECKNTAQKALERHPQGEEAAMLHSQLAEISARKKDYQGAIKEWDAARKVLFDELGERFHFPVQDWSQLVNEIGVLPQTDAFWFIIVRLCETAINQAICLQRLRQDPTRRFGDAYQALESLNLVDRTPARPRHMLARIYRAYAAYCESASNSDDKSARKRDDALKSALALEEDAIARYKSEIDRRPEIDWAVSTSLAWSYIGRLDCLIRMARTAVDSNRSDLDRDIEATLAKCKDSLEVISQSVDRHHQAEVAYANACLLSIQMKPNEAVIFLRTAIEKTRSAEKKFSNITNRVTLDEDLDNIRSDPAFQSLFP